MERWFRTDTYNELSDALLFTLQHLQSLPQNIESFRWTVVGSVLALQGACVHQLHGHDTTGTSTLAASSRRKVIDHLHERKKSPFPKERMATPIELLERVKLPEETANDFSKSWDGADAKNCEHFVMLRNEFMHFLPQGWSHCLVGFPDSLKSCWKIIRELLESPITYNHRLESDYLAKMMQTLDDIDREIFRLTSEW